jgi:hypothetical protein
MLVKELFVVETYHDVNQKNESRFCYMGDGSDCDCVEVTLQMTSPWQLPLNKLFDSTFPHNKCLKYKEKLAFDKMRGMVSSICVQELLKSLQMSVMLTDSYIVTEL